MLSSKMINVIREDRNWLSKKFKDDCPEQRQASLTNQPASEVDSIVSLAQETPESLSLSAHSGLVSNWIVVSCISIFNY